MAQLISMMNALNFDLVENSPTSKLFVHRENTDTAIIIDDRLFHDANAHFSYLEYTSWQNKLMHIHDKLFRFACDSLVEIRNQIEFFLSDQVIPAELKMFGRNRQEQDIDPTRPEYEFESIFEGVYGSYYLTALERESEYFDLAGKQRFVDYVLSTKKRPIAIELNGESFHHPIVVGLPRYQSQLFKQNSLVKSGFAVFRWSLRGMADQQKFADQMRSYFGNKEDFDNIPRFKAERQVNAIELHDHQVDALDMIAKRRNQGESTFLIVLPTGTGKTEIFIEDHQRVRQENLSIRALVIVPTTKLKEQTIARFRLRNPDIKAGELIADRKLDVCVQTTAFLTRHYKTYSAKEFDYIVVDEAHHAPAQGLRKILEHFTPGTLIGVTATDARLDQQSLAQIFGRYEVNLTLPQAIEQKLLPPIRAVRLETNIDFSQIRFNGKEFVKSDIQKNILLPSRDQLIVELLLKYFCSKKAPELAIKQGVIFCVDIKHAERVAKLLVNAGISAAAVSGKNRYALEQYEKGSIRFLCSCDLLNEGWDAPETSVLVMARPTISKVLYLQQLGRGTRRCEGKEALYVIDVVDSYGAAIQPWSLHSMFQINNYQPFADVFDVEYGANNELISLDHLWEGERKLIPLELFNYENEYGDLLNEEQLARELFVSTGTIHSWLKKGDISPDKTLPFGRKRLNYFSAEQVIVIREQKGLKERTEASRKLDFFEFLSQRDYTYSFKIIFLLSLLKKMDAQGEAPLLEIVKLYQSFYQLILNNFGRCEKQGSPLNDPGNLADENFISRSLLQNPFEKFERKRFILHSKDIDIMSFDSALWEKLNDGDKSKIRQQMIADAGEYYKKFLDIIVGKKELIEAGLISDETLITPTEVHIPTIGNGPFTELNYYQNIKIACGHFKPGSHDEADIINVGTGYGRVSPDRHFLARAAGNSMNGGKNPVQDNDLLLLEFITHTSAGSLRNQTVVIERNEYGANEYLLRKVIKTDQGAYVLRAFNPDYDDIEANESMKTRARLIRNFGRVKL